MGLGLAALMAVAVPASAQTTVKLLQNIDKYAGTGTAAANTAADAAATGQATLANVATPSGLGFDGQGNVYFSDYDGTGSGNVIHKVNNLGVISTVAGGGTNPAGCAGSTDAIGDGCVATQASLAGPYVIAVDRAGNIFLTDQQHNRIREVSGTTGIITTIVGTGTANPLFRSTTPTAALTVNINAPDGIAIDANDDVFFSDSTNSYIYKYFATGANAGKVQVYVGTGFGTFSGDNGQSTAAAVNNPIGLATDAAGNLYIADQLNNRIRFVNAASGVITTIAGNGTAGYAGDNGTAGNAEFSGPRSVALDNAGDLIVSDSANLVIRIIYAGPTGQVSTGSYIETLAGSGAACTTPTGACGDGGLAINGQFAPNGGGNGGSTQFGFNAINGTFYIADIADNRVRTLKPSTIFPATQVAGAGITQTTGIQLVGGAATISSITINPGTNNAQEFTVGTISSQPANAAEGTPSLTCSTNGTTSNAAGTICDIAVKFTPAYPGTRSAQLTVVTSAGTFVYGLTGTGVAPQAILLPGVLSTVAGTGTAGATGDGGAATAALLSGPRDLALDTAGNLYISDQNNNKVRLVNTAGVISVFAGGGTTNYETNPGGPATSAALLQNGNTRFDALANAYIADSKDHAVARVNTAGNIFPFAGTGTAGNSGDGGQAAAAKLSSPNALAIDLATGNVYISDGSNDNIRFVNGTTGIISTVAGTGTQCATATAACGDGAAATLAQFNNNQGVALLPNGDLIIADSNDNRVRKITFATGIITTIAGSGTASYTGDGGLATSATLSAPYELAVDAAGDIYIGDSGNNAIRVISAATGIISTVVGNGAQCATPNCGDTGPANVSSLYGGSGIALDVSGNFYVSSENDNQVRKVTSNPAAVAFATTPVSTTSADSPKTELLQNIGNSVLTLSTPGTGTNPSISTGYTEGTAQTCPQLSTTSAAGMLAAGASCSYVVSFTPTAVGQDTGKLVQTDNSLNAAGATQTLNLSGFATEDNPSLTLANAPNPSTYGQSVNLTATIAGNGTPATGTVNFYTVGAAMPIINLSAAPTSTTTSFTETLPAGTYIVTLPGTAGGGQFDGWNPAQNPTTNNRWTDRFGVQIGTGTTYAITDDQGAGGTDPGFATAAAAITAYQNAPQFQANPVGTQTGAEVGNPYVFTLTSPQSVTFSVPDPGSFGDDTGGLSLLVTPYTQIATAQLNGTSAVGATAVLPVGTTPTIAIYQGDANHVGAVSNIVPQVVNKAANDTLAASPAVSTYGTPVTLTFSIPVAAGTTAPAAGDTVTFTYPGPNGAVTINTPATVAIGPVVNGVQTYTATTTTSALPIGTYNVTGTLSNGDPNYAAQAASAQVTVNKAPATTTDSVTGTGTYGAATSPITVTIPYSGAIAPTGLITVNGPNGTTTTIQASACTAANGTLTCPGTFPSATLPVGANALTVSQAADANYSGSTGTGTLTLAKAPATTTDAVTGTGTYGAPTSPITVTIPYTGTATPTGLITVNGPNGTTTTIQASACTAANATLTCPGTFPSATLPVGANALTVSQAGDANYTGSTGTGTLTLAKVPATTNDSVTGTGTYGAPTSPITVTIPYTGTAKPTGLITVNGPNGTTTTIQASACTAANQTLTCPGTFPSATLPVGANALTVSQAGDANYSGSTGTGTLTLAKAPATTTDAVTGTGTYGAPTSPITVTIPYTGTATPTGLITVNGPNGTTTTIQASACTAANATLTCPGTFPSGTLPIGANALTVSQAGDANYTGSTGTGTLTLAKAPATTNDSVTGTGTYGAPTSPITVTVPYTGTAAPTGLITVNGPNGLTTTIQASACTAANQTLTCPGTFPSATLPLGGTALTVSQAGDANYTGSTGTGTLTLAKAPATTNDSVTGTGTYGAPTSPITVTIPYTGTAAPTGLITVNGPNGTTTTIQASACTAANATLTCPGTFPSGTLPIGANALTVSQAGDANYTGSTGTGTLTLAKAPATTGDSVTGNGTYGAATSPITVTIPYSGTATPTGLITVNGPNGTTTTIQASACTAANATLTCPGTFPSATLPVGANALTVSQAADANYSGSTGTGTLTLAKTPATTGDSVTGTGTYGAPTSPITVTIPYSGTATPTGLITVNGPNGLTTTIQASACTAANKTLTCPGTFPSATLPLGGTALTVSEAADANYAGSTGTGTLTLTKAPATTGDSVTGTGTYGAPTSPITVTIPYTGTATPTGLITVNGPNGTTLTIQASSCTAANQTLTCPGSYPSATLPVGANALTVSQAADANYSGSTGTGTLTLAKAPATTNDAVTGTGTYGAPTSPITVTIPYTGTATPTGLITVNGPKGTTTTIQASACTAANATLTCPGTFPSATLPVGANALTVSQAGDANYTGSTGTGILTLNQPGASTADTANGTGTFGSATSPVTVTIPYSGTASPTGLISVFGPKGTTVTVPASACTAANQTLTCPVNFPSITLPAGANALTVTQAGDANYLASSGGGTLTLAKLPATGDTLTVAKPTITFGQDDMLTFTVAVPANETLTPGGTVTFTVGSYTSGPIAVTVTNGVATATVDPTTLPVGTNQTVTAVYSGDANYAGTTLTGAVTVNAAGGDTVSIPSPVIVGEPTPITFTIPVVNGVPPTGTVTCSSGTTVLGTTTVTGGTTVLTTTLLPLPIPPATTTPVSCVFTPTPGSPYAPGSPTGSTVVTKVPGTGDTLTVAKPTITFGQDDMLTFTVAVPANETLTPGGTVTFTVGSYTSGPIAVTVTNGVATATVDPTTLPVGTNQTVTAVYSGDANYAANTQTGAVTVNAAGGDTVSIPSPVIVGEPTPITFTIPVVNGVPPTGSVTCSSGTTVLGTTTVTGGTTVLTTTLLPLPIPPATTTPVSCVFTPTPGSPYAPGSPTGSTVVTKVPGTGDTLTVAKPTITFGQDDMLTFTVAIPANETLTPGGTVTFTVGSYTSGPIAVTVTNGVATATVDPTTLPVGTNQTVTAVYSGDANYAGTTLTGAVTVNAAGGDTVSIPSPVIVGEPTPITFTIPVVNGVPPTGTVTCSSGTTVLGTTTVTGGTTVLTTTLLPLPIPPATTTPVSCVFTPTPGSPYAPGSPTGSTVVTKVPGTGDTLTVAKPTITFGQDDMLTFTVAVPANETLTPGGTVTFTVGSYTSGPIAVTVTNGVATATVDPTTLPVGANQTVTAVYSGDANYAGTTLTGAVTVLPAGGDTISISPTPSSPGAPVGITLTIPVINGIPPTGTVTCSSGATVLGTTTVTGGTTVLTTTLLPTSPAGGTTPVSCVFTPTPGSPYAPATPTGTTVVAPSTPPSVVTSGPTNPTCGSAITLTDTVGLINGQATYGTVQFYNTVNGVTTPIGAPVSISPGGVATLTTTSLPCSADSITAIYTPASNPLTPNVPPPYTPSTGGPLSIALADFTISATPPLITLNPGDTATYTVALSGAGGVAFPLPVTLTATGLPAGATVTFANGRYIPGVGPTPTTMTIVTSPLHSQLIPRGGASNIYYGLLLLPLLGVRRIRRKLKVLPRGVLYGLTALLLISGVGAMTGCAGGYFGPNPNTYTITVTGTSGTLVHSTSVTLTIR